MQTLPTQMERIFTPHERPNPKKGKARWDAIVHNLHAMPTIPYYSQAQLEALTISELKQLLTKCQARKSAVGDGGSQGPAAPLEKREVVQHILELGGSSSQTCPICFDEYQGGDELRVLRCAHRYHLECVDLWFLRSNDYSRAPACPLCNEPLLVQ